jgi:RNA polymerase sigma-70 factor (ECF subfamily)
MVALDKSVRKAVGGDTDALTDLLRAFAPAVERFLRIDRPWRSLLETSDVMQVTYLEAFLQIGGFDAERGDSFEAWLRRIAENNLRDAVRGLQRQKRPQPRDRVTPSGSDSVTGLFDLLGVTTTTPSRQAVRSEMDRHLSAALEALPSDYAQAIRLYDLEGFAINDVAAQMGRSPGAVHMLRARAHDWLRERLGAEFGSMSRLP